MKKATIYDYARMCKFYDDCKKCPVGSYDNGTGVTCDYFIRSTPDKANKIILNWCEEHPVETRQDRLLKVFPEANIYSGSLDICPLRVDRRLDQLCVKKQHCIDCKKEYWLAEVEENE